MKLFASAAAALGLALAAAPTLANAPKQRMATITTSDIDLATPKGHKELNRRIDRAVRSVCQINNLAAGSRTLTHEAHTCIAKARTSAQSQVARIMAAKDRTRG